MKLLILGGSGMLGHKLWQIFSDRFDTHVTLRQPLSSRAVSDLFDPARLHLGVLAEDFEGLRSVLGDFQPDVVVNCIGIVKRDAAAKDPEASINVNALFPHRLAKLCRGAGSR